jgi:hypothetical protein
MSIALLIAFAPWSEAQLRRILQGLIGTALVVGAYCTLRSVIGSSTAEIHAGDAVRGLLGQKPSLLDSRFIGSFGSPQDLGEWTSLAAVFCFSQALALKGRWRLIAAAATGFCIVALIASDIRIGLIAAVGGCAVVLLVYQLSLAFPGPRIGIVTVAAVLAVGAGAWAFGFTGTESDQKAQRYGAIFHPSTDYAFQLRQSSWSGAFDRAKDKPFGQGLGTAGIVRQTHPQPGLYGSSNLDSSYLKVALEQGFFVLAFLAVTLLLLLFGLVRRAIVTTDPARAGPAIGAAGVLVAMLIMFYIGDYIEGSSALAGWMLIGIGLAAFTRPEEPDDSHAR